MLRTVAFWIDWVVLALAGGLVTLLGGVWWARLRYPFDLEWMEGGMLAHAWRVQRGLPIYAPPSPEWIPYVYPPGYSWILAALGQVFGLDYPVGRAASILATLASGAALVFVGQRLRRPDPLVGAWAAAVFLGAFPASGAFYDMVRPDATFVALTAWAIALSLVESTAAAAGSGLLLAAAFLCKHNAAAFGPALLLAQLARGGWRPALAFTLASAVPAGLATAGLQWTTDGWFLTYLLEVPRSHPQLTSRVFPGMPRELGDAFPALLAAIAVGALLRTRELRWSPGPAIAIPVFVGLLSAVAIDQLPAGDTANELFGLTVATGAGALGVTLTRAALVSGDALVRRLRGLPQALDWRSVLVFGVGLTALVMAALMRRHNGGYLNVYMQLHWTLCAAFAATLAAWRATDHPVGRIAAGGFALAQLGWQLIVLRPEALTPTAADAAAGAKFVEALRALPPGPVFSPYAAWLPVQAGRAPSMPLISLWDLEHEEGPLFAECKQVKAELRRGDRFVGVLDGTTGYGRGIGDGYVRGEPLALGEGVFDPQTGWQVRPSVLWTPKDRP